MSTNTKAQTQDLGTEVVFVAGADAIDCRAGALSVDCPFVINAIIGFWRAGRQEHSRVWTALLLRMATQNRAAILKTV